MNFLILFELILKILNKSHKLKIITLFTFPLWIQYNFFPEYYGYLKSTFSLKIAHVELITFIISFVLNIMIYIGYTMIFFIIGCLVSWIAQCVFKSVLGLFDVWMPPSNYFRNEIIKFSCTTYLRLGLYMTTLAIYSDLIISYDVPLKIITSTEVFWISLFSFNVIFLTLAMSLVIPTKSYR